MSSGEQVPNYFLLVEDGGVAHVRANGAGLNVVEAMARMSLLATSHSFSVNNIARGFASYHTSDKVERRLGFDQVMNASEASKLLNAPYKIARLYFDEELSKQVIAGNRSPQSVVNQMTQQAEDERLLHRNGFQWFDTEGRQVVPPILREREGVSLADENDESLSLGSVRRDSTELTIRPDAKKALYDSVPSKRSKTRSSRVMPYANRYHRYSSCAFSDGEPLLHKTFGYLEDGHFVPVVTDLAPNHPVVIKHKKNQKNLA